MIKKIKENKKLCLILGLILFACAIMTICALFVIASCLMKHDVNCVCDFCPMIYDVALKYDNINVFCIFFGSCFYLLFDACLSYIMKYAGFVVKYFKKDKKDSE